MLSRFYVLIGFFCFLNGAYAGHLLDVPKDDGNQYIARVIQSGDKSFAPPKKNVDKAVKGGKIQLVNLAGYTEDSVARLIQQFELSIDTHTCHCNGSPHKAGKEIHLNGTSLSNEEQTLSIRLT